MDNEIKLPFKVGESAEAKSFEEGYRGAWFRCKIKQIAKRRGELGYVSQYIDYPDEKENWTRFFEVPPHNVGKAKSHKELMLRPEYPPICNEKKIPTVISEVTVIVNDSWKVGDLVDWWYNECHWSGKITQLCGKDKAKIELPGPPLGEGESYDILFKDIRPSLNWSLENGWTLPTQEGKSRRPCARLIKPINQATPTPSINSADSKEPPILDKQEVTDPRQRTAGQSVKLPLSKSAKVSKKQVKDDKKEKSVRKRNNVENSTSSAEPPAGVEVAEDLNSGCSLEKKKSKCIESKGAAATLNSVRSDTLEAAVMDLEEYVNKVKWLKQILHHGISSSSDDASKSRWEFVDTTALENPK